MKCETIDFSDNRVINIIDNAVDTSTQIDLYYQCCMAPYRISNSCRKEVQGISDRRLKCNIEDVTGSLAVINNLEPVRFN